MNSTRDSKLILFACLLLCAGVFCLTSIPLHGADDNWRTANRDRMLIAPTRQSADEVCKRLAEMETNGYVGLCTGRSMGSPQTYLAVYRDDFPHVQIGDRIRFASKDGKFIVHRVIVRKGNVLTVSGETYPQRIDYVTRANYLGTVVEICTWVKE